MPAGLPYSGYRGGSQTVALSVGTFYSDPIVVDSECDHVSIRLQYPAGVTAGVVSLQITNIANPDTTTETDWTDASSEINNALQGLDGIITSEILDIIDAAFIYRVKFVVTTGSGTVLLHWSLKA